MSKSDFHTEKKWCEKCNAYKRYLMSVNHSFCLDCGSKVRLFSRKDAAEFGEVLQRRRWRSTGS